MGRRFAVRLKFVPDWRAISVSSYNSKVWGKWYGLAECLIFHSRALEGGEGERDNHPPFHFLYYLMLRERGSGSLPLCGTHQGNQSSTHEQHASSNAGLT
jgi:hypothetical protein